VRSVTHCILIKAGDNPALVTQTNVENMYGYDFLGWGNLHKGNLEAAIHTLRGLIIYMAELLARTPSAYVQATGK